MRGVWYTTGGGLGASTVAAAAAALYGAAWIAAHLIELVTVAVICAILTGIAIRWLMSWSERRDARIWAQRSMWTARAEATPVRAGQQPHQVPTAAPQTVITGGTHIWLSGLPSPEQAHVIRKAIEGN